MTKNELKKAVGFKALEFVKPNTIVGVGTGSTASYFIDALATMKNEIIGAVSSSKASTEKLKSYDIPVFDCNEVESLDVYIDGADEINEQMQMIKGGGAALTREKIIASLSKQFVCIVDESKQVKTLGKFPLPIEVIPMARAFVAREIIKLGGKPIYRENTITDNGNIILDIHDFMITNPTLMESTINNIAGVVTVGIFANKAANVVLVGTKDGVKTIKS